MYIVSYNVLASVIIERIYNIERQNTFLKQK